MSRVPANVTPFKAPWLLSTPWRMALPAVLTVPPLIVPPATVQVPVVSLRARVVPELFNIPVRLTIPPERLKVPRSATANVPPRFTVELFVEVIVPELCHVDPL